MVKHIILWQLKDELSDAEKATRKAWRALWARCPACWKCM